MSEGLLVEARSAAGRCLRMRLWPLPASAQLLRRVVSEVLGAAPADSLPLVVVSPADGVRSLRVAGRGMDAHLDLSLSDLVVGVPDGVAGGRAGTPARHALFHGPGGRAAGRAAPRMGRDGLRLCVDAPYADARTVGIGPLRPARPAACGHPFRRGPAGLRRSRRRPRRAVLTRRSSSIDASSAGTDFVPASVCLRLTWRRPGRRVAPEGSWPMARPSPDFIERALELQGTVRARASAAETAWALRSAAHTGEDSFDALARRVTSSPVRVAGVLSGEHDPLLLCALAGKRSMEDLAGVTPAGGRPNAAPTMLESLAARRVQQHWELCRTDPAHAKRLEAKWAASRATMRSGHLGPALAAMEATYGAACSAEREAAQGRLVSTVPPASWDPAGAHAGKLAGYGSARWNRMRGQAVAETQMPGEWQHRRTANLGSPAPAGALRRTRPGPPRAARCRAFLAAHGGQPDRLPGAAEAGDGAGSGGDAAVPDVGGVEPAAGGGGRAGAAGPDGRRGGDWPAGDRGDARGEVGAGGGAAGAVAGRAAQAGRGAAAARAYGAGRRRCGHEGAARRARRRAGLGQGDAGGERALRRQGVAGRYTAGRRGWRLERGHRVGRAVPAGERGRQRLRRVAGPARGGGRRRHCGSAAGAVLAGSLVGAGFGGPGPGGRGGAVRALRRARRRRCRVPAAP